VQQVFLGIRLANNTTVNNTGACWSLIMKLVWK